MPNKNGYYCIEPCLEIKILKEQLDQLKTENEDLQKRFNGIYNFNKKILDQNHKLACREIHLKQTLTEIKEIVKPVEDIYPFCGHILQKISEVEQCQKN